MFKEKFHITSSDVDQFLELRLANLFKYFQILGSDHVETIGMGHQDLFKHNLLWVVIRMEVKILRTPKLEEVLTFTTHPGDNRSFIYPRYYEVYDAKGNLIITASSMWALIDKDTRRVVLKPDGLKTIKGESHKDDIPLPEKVAGESSNIVCNRKVVYSDIDLNGHLNNTKYIEFMVDTHEPEFYKTHRIAKVNVNYDKEIKYGDEVILSSNNNEEKEVIHGKVGDTVHFSAEFTYENR